MSEPQKFLQGQVVNGQYPLREYLGGSDHGAVFVTEHGMSTKRKAAIKLVAARPGNAESQLSRWRVAANLTRPNLLRILDFGRCELGNTAMLYVVMEYAEEDLSQIVPQRALTPAEARQMLEPVVDALEFVHSRGCVHGRLRPSNILAVGDQIKLSTDGMQRIDEARDTPAKLSIYDAPESATGGLSPSCDVWSLGMTLAETLTQRLPAAGPETQREVRLPENMPEEFAEVVAHCLRRDLRRRWKLTDIQDWLKRGSRAKDAPTSAPARTAAVAAERHPEARPEASARPRWAIPAMVVGALIAAAVVAGPKFVDRGGKDAPDSSGAVSASADTRERAHNSKPAETKKREEQPPTEPAVIPAKTEGKPAEKTVAAGAVAQEVMPQVSEKARDSIEGTVRVNVRVKVDENGNVADATLAAPGPSKYFSELSLKTAREWRFFPASADGQNIPSEWVLQFGYSNSGTKVNPVQEKP